MENSDLQEKRKISREYLDTLELSGDGSKPTLYDEFRVFYRTTGDISKFRKLKLEKYY
jgi:hypothetical protein